MLNQDLQRNNVPLWAYFCQISDSTTSYGSYSGAVPNEKITWGKLSVVTPKFIIESDATIVAPLIFAKVLGWGRFSAVFVIASGLGPTPSRCTEAPNGLLPKLLLVLGELST